MHADTGLAPDREPRQGGGPSSEAQAAPAGAREPPSWREHQPPGLMSTLGPLLSRREAGGWAYGLRIDDRHLNRAGIVHGGTTAALMDQALSTVAWEHAGKAPCLTVQLNMSFVRAAQPGQVLTARGKVVHASGSMLFVDGTLHADDVLIATAQAIMKRLGPR